MNLYVITIYGKKLSIVINIPIITFIVYLSIKYGDTKHILANDLISLKIYSFESSIKNYDNYRK